MENTNRMRRIVVKLGTSTLTHPNGKLNILRIEHLVRCIADLSARGYEMVVVSSGAVGVGVGKLALAQRPQTLSMKQAAAAVGQCALMHIYDKMFMEYGLTVGQILLTRYDITSDTRRDNLHNTFQALLQTGVVPIVNENDSVSIEELEALDTFGDNDTLSAVVARLCKADLLVIFTDMDGLFEADPRHNPEAKLIGTVSVIDEHIRAIAGGAGTAGGTGGMATKLSAAALCMEAGIAMRITNGARPEDLCRIVDGEQIGTLFDAGERTSV